MNTQRVEGHTPTPWDYRAGAGNCDQSITADGKTIAEMRGDATGSAVDHQAYANARFLVHACNNIERLEKVNEALVSRLEDCLTSELTQQYGRHKGLHETDCSSVQDYLRPVPCDCAWGKLADALRMAKEPA